MDYNIRMDYNDIVFINIIYILYFVVSYLLKYYFIINLIFYFIYIIGLYLIAIYKTEMRYIYVVITIILFPVL